MTAAYSLQHQAPCTVCETDRQMQSCRPGTAVGPIEPCPACGPEQVPVRMYPMYRDVRRGGES